MKKVKEITDLEIYNKQLEVNISLMLIKLLNSKNLKKFGKVVFQGNITNLDKWNTNLNDSNNFDQNNFFNSNPDNYINVKDSRSLLKLKEVVNLNLIIKDSCSK